MYIFFYKLLYWRLFSIIPNNGISGISDAGIISYWFRFRICPNYDTFRSKNPANSGILVIRGIPFLFRGQIERNGMRK